MQPHPTLPGLDELVGEPETIDLSSDFSTSDDPEMANMATEQVLEGINRKPQIEEAPSGQVELPGGWVDPETGDLHQTAFVNELNGLAEEKLARIDPTVNLPLLLQTMIECSLENIGGHAPSSAMIKSLLIGDREALILGIRIATYGEQLEMHISCPECGAEEDLALELSKDVPVKKMETPTIREYDVELRKGRIAVVTPTTVAIQDDVWDVKKTAAEMKTATLQRCVKSIDGQPVSHSVAQSLGLADRKAILDFLDEVQPGPDYEGVRLPCGSCGQEFRLRLDLTALFR